MQNNILQILEENPLIPVVTINDLNDIDKIYIRLKSKNVRCIEITLRTDVSREAIKLFKEKYGDWILYDPVLNKNTYILWLLPILIFLIGGAIILKSFIFKK